MNKDRSYESPVLLRIVSVVGMIAICVCSVLSYLSYSKSPATAAAANQSSGGNASSSSGSSSSGSSSGGSSASSGSASSGAASSDGSASDAASGDNAADGDAAAADSSSTATPEECLEKYTEVMQQLKDGVASYDKIEYQDLPSDKYDLGSVGNVILPLANGFMTTKDKAEIQNRKDKEQIPVIDNAKGCLLTDASKIKSASMTESDGKTTIVITLVDENDPEPAKDAATSPSYTGAMFAPLSRIDINAELSKISVVKVNNFTLTYHDCTSTLVFDTATGNVESLEQVNNVHIVANAKVTLFTLDGYAELINTMIINNVKYK